MMLPVLPFDIIKLIIDIIAENKDVDLLKELALVSHFFLPICRKHLFAAVELYDCGRKRTTSSKQGFIKLVKNNPDIVKYIRKLTYNPSYLDDRFLSSILPNFLRTISRLEHLTITSAWTQLDWKSQHSSIKSALLFLMHLPTINHIELGYLKHFPFSALAPCLNLKLLDISCVEFMMPLEGDSHLESIHLHRFSTFNSTLATKELLHAKRRDGRPVFNFRGLEQVSVAVYRFEDYQNARYLLQNSECLEVLRMQDFFDDIHSLSGVLYHNACTLRFLYLRVPLGDELPIPLAGLCEGLEAIAGHNVLEALELEVTVEGHETKNTIGFIIQQLEEVLMKPGWSTLKQVRFKISIACCLVSGETREQLSDELQSLPEKYLSRLSKLELITFDYSACVVTCGS